jgi:hypothetical protein
MPDLSILPKDLQLNVLSAIVLIKLAAEFISAIRNGGGLRRILLSFWFGENLPQVVAADYKAELSRPPFPPSTPPPAA